MGSYEWLRLLAPWTWQDWPWLALRRGEESGGYAGPLDDGTHRVYLVDVGALADPITSLPGDPNVIPHEDYVSACALVEAGWTPT